jgi:hypothetical protein
MACVLAAVSKTTEWPVADDHIVALALHTQENLQRLDTTFQGAWPVEDAPEFGKLLLAIDQRDRRLTPGREWSSLLGTS